MLSKASDRKANCEALKKKKHEKITQLISECLKEENKNIRAELF